LWKILLANTTVNSNIIHSKLLMFGIWKGQMGPHAFPHEMKM
jgi:hypothetical protein